MAKKIKAVILAGGLGTRMRSRTPKVLHPLGDKPMIRHILDTVRSCGIDDIICVVGHKAELVKRELKDARLVVQKRPLGSGDALNQAKSLLKDFKGEILVLCGDEPLIRRQTIEGLIRSHAADDNFCTLLTARMMDPTGYGRILKNDRGHVIDIVEETEASIYDKAIDEINVGVYCFRSKGLFSFLKEIKNENNKGEYFLTDIVSLLNRKGHSVGSYMTEDSDEAIGINSRRDLCAAENILRRRTVAELMDKGVTISDPDTVHISVDARIGEDTTIFSHTIIEGRVKIGKGCRIGPFARIRPGCELKDGVEIGNFVELVRAKVGENTRIKHHTYLGDTVVGKDVNIGAGTITANYDGKEKAVTRIEDRAFIGSGTIFVAPVKVGRNAKTGAGAIVTKNHNVPAGSVVVGMPARVLKGKKGARK
ncbi:MAG: sugar phosphate nucleotidyltransferase [Candidatus Omnitrophota bacterium]